MLIQVLTVLAVAAGSAPALAEAPRSAVLSVEIKDSTPVGTFGGTAFHRIRGTIHGSIVATEAVAGLCKLAAGRTTVPYDSQFEMIVPDDPQRADGVVVEAENRGGSVLLPMMDPGGATQDRAAGKPPIGDGFLFAQGLSFARVQWQHGIAASVPEGAQGMGEVILRDFGRLLGGTFPQVWGHLPIFRHRIFAGVSQSAWMVNSFIAEGFNRDPATGRAVYQGAFTRNGGGAVLAINGYAMGKAQTPYVPDGEAPLTPKQLLSRPKSDPMLVDIGSLTDYYRLRASVFAHAQGAPGFHRYATAAPHAPGRMVPQAMIFGTFKCNGGVPVASIP